ncbi:unnamed protein product [Alopecurus aequalis]
MADGAASFPKGDHGGEGRISTLHEDLLYEIIRRLLVTAAVRTTGLASRWRHLWRSIPLVLFDSDLPEAGRAAIVARILAEHPGPFRTICLIDSSFASLDLELADWPRLLDAKGTQELILYNKPTGTSSRLPAGIFRCASLERLSLAYWTFPDDLPRVAGAFPNLQLLGMMCIFISDQDVECLLAASPVLQTLAFHGITKRVHISNQNLRCVIAGLCSMMEEFAVVEAPLLEWFVFLEAPRGEADRVTVKIVCAPNLRVLGYLEPRIHRLQIGDNTITPDTRASPSTLVPGVKILAMKVNFGDLWEVKMLASFLRCFPNVDTLHIQVSSRVHYPSVLHDQSVTAHEHLLKFWQEASPVECLRSHIKRMVIDKFRGDQNEFEFLKFMATNAQELQSLLVVSPDENFALADKVNEMINKLGCRRFRPWTARGLLGSPTPWNTLIFEKVKVSDLTVDDPFY